MNKKTGLACALAAAIVALSGCTPAIYTIGGTIPSTNPSKGATKAQFSLSGDSCDGDLEATGTFTYHDKSATAWNPKQKGVGLQMTGPVLFVSDCSNPTAEGEAEFCAGAWEGDLNPEVQYLLDNCPLRGQVSGVPVKYFGAIYVSTNARYPGEGIVFGCAQDNGQGGKVDYKDWATIIVPSEFEEANGPYAGYRNTGSVQGNVATFACPELPPT